MQIIDFKRLKKRFKVYRYAFFMPLTFVDKPLCSFLFLFKHKFKKKKDSTVSLPLKAVFKFF